MAPWDLDRDSSRVKPKLDSTHGEKANSRNGLDWFDEGRSSSFLKMLDSDNEFSGTNSDMKGSSSSMNSESDELELEDKTGEELLSLTNELDIEFESMFPASIRLKNREDDENRDPMDKAEPSSLGLRSN